MKLSNNKILITGGGTGIGLGLTERFVIENNTVIICGRRVSVLNEVAEKIPGVIIRQCDLSVEEERKELFKWVEKNHPDLNVLINNAGIQNHIKITDDDFYNRSKNEVEVNVLAPLHLTNLFIKLPSLTTIINVTSGLAFVPYAKIPVYCGSKAFVRSFTLSARHLLKDKIEVIEMIPPALNTDLGGKGLHDHAPAVSDFVTSVFEQMKEGKNELTFGTSETRAKANNDTISDYFNKMNG